MKLVRTAKIKLDIKVEDILPTVLAYTNAYNTVCQVGYEKKISNSIELHKLTYKPIRNKSNLTADLTISARDKASESLRSVFGKNKNKYPKCPNSKLISIRYVNNKSYYINIKKEIISISTINGRIKTNLVIPKYYKEYFQNWIRKSAELCIKNNKVYLHIAFEKEIKNIIPNGKIVGIDRGINNLAVSSDNKFYSGRKIKKICDKYRKLRRKLQKSGSKSAKRHLKILSGKEKRFKADVNHCVAKEIVSNLKSGDVIVLENLSGIRNKRMRKRERIMINSWNFYQLEEFIKYKAALKGIKVVFVNPAYTSQHCIRCGHTEKSNRNSCHFSCKNCNFKMNADLIGAKNILLKYLGVLNKEGMKNLKNIQISHKPNTNRDRLPVNQPIVPMEMSGIN
jgi:putative transposase